MDAKTRARGREYKKPQGPSKRGRWQRRRPFGLECGAREVAHVSTCLFSASSALLALALGATRKAAIAPDAAHSPNAEDMRTAYWVMLDRRDPDRRSRLIGGLLVAVRRFRSTGSGGRAAPPHRRPRRHRQGRRRASALLSLVIFIFGVVVSNGVKEATAEEGVEEIEIDAVAQQWLWRFEYPGAGRGQLLRGHRDRSSATASSSSRWTPLVHLNIDSTDVLHSWFVPALGPQVWAVPGEIQETSFIADEEGLYRGRSTVFSGAAGYPVMRANVRVVSAEEYADYIETA